MTSQFTTIRDIANAFARAMNLIDPTLQKHHEKVAYLSFRLAQTIRLDKKQRILALYGGLFHDIGGALKQGNVSLADIESNARNVAETGASLLRLFPVTHPFADIVLESQSPRLRFQKLKKHIATPYLIGQIVHLADTIALLCNEATPALNQVQRIKECIHDNAEEVFDSSVLEAFDILCNYEYVWLDLMYKPELFLDLIEDNRWLSLDEVVNLTSFMSKIIDFRSPFTAMHSAGVSATAVALARRVGMSENECKMMRIAGYLHDIGKLKIPREILEKPGKLTSEEFNVMKEHVYYTWILLKDIYGFEQIATWAAYHHEKLNGNGYPFHLSQEDIPLGSRIMTVADIFSAITEERPYRKSMDKEKVISLLRQDAENGLLSTRLVNLLVNDYDEINRLRDIESKAASKKYQESLANSSKE